MLLNDKVSFRMQWPQYADLQVNGKQYVLLDPFNLAAVSSSCNFFSNLLVCVLDITSVCFSARCLLVAEVP